MLKYSGKVKTLDFVEFGRLVRNIRVNRGLTLEEASEMCDLSSKGLENIELGIADPKLSTVLRISSVFNISYDDFNDKIDA